MTQGEKPPSSPAPPPQVFQHGHYMPRPPPSPAHQLVKRSHSWVYSSSSLSGNIEHHAHASHNTKYQQSQILFVSLLENFCQTYDRDPRRNRLLFFKICQRLCSMGIIGKEFLDQVAPARAHYSQAFKRLVLQAIDSIKAMERQQQQQMRLLSSGAHIEDESTSASGFDTEATRETDCSSSNGIGSHNDDSGFSTHNVAYPRVAEADRTSGNGDSYYYQFSDYSFTNILQPHHSPFRENYVQLRQLGSGGFGKVFEVKNKLDGRHYAIKVIRIRGDVTIDKTLREIKLLAQLNHPNIVRYYYSWTESQIYPAASKPMQQQQQQRPAHARHTRFSKSVDTRQSSFFHEASPQLINPSTPRPCASFDTHKPLVNRCVEIESISDSDSDDDSEDNDNNNSDHSSANEVDSPNIEDDNSDQMFDLELGATEGELLRVNRRSEAVDISINFEDDGTSGGRSQSAETDRRHRALTSDGEDNCSDDGTQSSGSRSNSSSIIELASSFRERVAIGVQVQEGVELAELGPSMKAIGPKIWDRGIPLLEVPSALTLFVQMQLCHTNLQEYLRQRAIRIASRPPDLKLIRCGSPLIGTADHDPLVDPVQNMRIFRAIVEGVKCIHENNLIHRDLKPANIFLDIQFDDKGESSSSNSNYNGKALSSGVRHPGELEDGAEDFAYPSLSKQQINWDRVFGEPVHPPSPSKEDTASGAGAEPSLPQALAEGGAGTSDPPSSSARSPLSGDCTLPTLPICTLPYLRGHDWDHSSNRSHDHRHCCHDSPRRGVNIKPLIGDFGLATTLNVILNSNYDSETAGTDSHDSSSSGPHPTPALWPDLAYQAHTSNVGTVTYAAPEQLNASPLSQFYSQKADIYSLGIIFFELYYPFATQMERTIVLKELREGRLPNEFVTQWPKEAAFVLMLTAQDPELRPTASDILKSGLFDIYDPESELLRKKVLSLTSKLDLERRKNEELQAKVEVLQKLLDESTRSNGRGRD